MLRITTVPLLLIFSSKLPKLLADVSCRSHTECELALEVGSECVDGICTNPFYQGGCLKSMLSEWDEPRTCNSEDPPSAIAKGYCRSSPMGYREVRIASENWESAFFGAWIMQILLSELLDVPTTIESGSPLINMNLYHVNSSFGYGTTTDFDALKRGWEIGECHRLSRSGPVSQTCSHVIPEYWVETLHGAEDYLELSDLGCLASNNWFIPKFTAERDPSLVSYTGLVGEKNRQKLAQTFLRPISWSDYCQLVSEDLCASEDGVALRAPLSEAEAKSYFWPDAYSGHFRATDENDCDQNPFNCTGHIADFPCSWGASVSQQVHHLNIALKSSGPDEAGGYSYTELTQIWAAANATKSDVIMLWWSPEVLYQTFLGTDAEYTRVVLPPPTQTCTENRVAEPRCGFSLNEINGSPEGACDFSPQILQKVISKALQDKSNSVPQELWSPSYDALMNYKISDLQLGRIFDYWHESEIDKWNFGPRKAACRWVAENINLMKTFIPASHPRVIEPEDMAGTVLFIIALVLAIIALSLEGLSILLTTLKRKKRSIFYAQEQYLYLLLFGMVLTTSGSLLLVFPVTNETCLSSVWLTNVGFSVSVVPSYMRIQSIHHLLQMGKKMQRVHLSNHKLLGAVAVTLCAMSGFLIAWTILDAPQQQVQYHLTENMNAHQKVIVNSVEYCSSGSNVWTAISFVWQGFLLSVCAMIAFISMAVREDINDTRSLAAMFSSMLCFFLFRVVLWALRGAVNASKLMGYTSVLYTIDCIIAIVIYVIPKFFVGKDEEEVTDTEPDLFIETTIMVADVAGFSAWSSVREPVQVFKFLEMLYNELDDLAEKRKVFKVETSGESYVAASGIPRAQLDHAVIIARFAWDCLNKMALIGQSLEVTFGPDTGNLQLRIGIHSGPVTGGFLKGKGARFQLFGDTMNTAIQTAKASERGRVRVTAQTASLLVNAGKGRWLEKHDENIPFSGVVSNQAHWLVLSRKEACACEGSEASNGYGSDFDLSIEGRDRFDDTTSQRLISWNVEILHNLLKQIIARRSVTGKITDEEQKSTSYLENFSSTSEDLSEGGGTMPLNEVKEIIALPEFDPKAAAKQKPVNDVNVPEHVLEQLSYFVTTIAQMYNNNPFHNFRHASHVVMAVTKFMNRINEARELNAEDRRMVNKLNDKKLASALHDHTYGITSDPLTQFACVFSALIHDVDHPGVPNVQLVKENQTLASTYRCRSVAEQNSFDLSWNLLADAHFKDLLATICASKKELLRFRQIVINSVMATDLGDKELKELRNGRWEKAFCMGENENDRDAINRKATIVVEHLIQAADVSHTSQHWEVYRLWNENLFRELYKAYRQGRADRNPAVYWYQGEIGFFDFYIIPLAKKLRDCGVFGLTSDENLNYAMQNRELWVERGNEITLEMLERAQAEFDCIEREE